MLDAFGGGRDLRSEEEDEDARCHGVDRIS
jgi:hypothetical protein